MMTKLYLFLRLLRYNEITLTLENPIYGSTIHGDSFVIQAGYPFTLRIGR